MAKRQVGLFSVMSAPKPKRGRESEEGLSISEEVTFDATNDPSVAELEDLRVEDENGRHIRNSIGYNSRTFMTINIIS